MELGQSAIDTDNLNAAASSIALEVAQRCLESIMAAKDGSPNALSVPAQCGLAADPVGAALLFNAVNEFAPEERWIRGIAKAMKLAASGVNYNLGLMRGWAGLLAAATTIGRSNQGSYRLLQYDLARKLNLEIRESRRADCQQTSDFELMDGLAGSMLGLGDATEIATMHEYLAYCLWLTEDSSRWRVPRPGKVGARYNNYSLSHGIAGMVSALRVAASEDGARLIAKRIADCLVRVRIERDGVTWWPSDVGADNDLYPTRMAWCYGTPGVACALYNAGQIIQDDELTQLTISILESLASLPLEAWGCIDAGICHGYAGVALIFWRFSILGNSLRLRNAAIQLATLAARLFSTTSRWGFTAARPNGEMRDSLNLLEGSTGVALVLLTIGGLCSDWWSRYLAIP